jgi:hypothetical protein
MDDDCAKIVLRVQKFLPDPKQVMFTLLIERNIRPDAGVGKKVVPDAAGQPQPFIEMKMSRWQHSPELPNRLNQPFWAAPCRKLDSLKSDTVRQKRSVSPIVEPIRASNGIVEEGEKQILVVPFEEYRRVWRRKPPDQAIDNAFRVRAAIDVVSEKDENDRHASSAPLIPFDQAQQGLEQIKAAMNVPDGVKPDTFGRAWLFSIVVPEFQSIFSPAKPLRFAGRIAERDNARWHSFAAFFSQSSKAATGLASDSSLISILLPSMVSYPCSHSV